MYSMSQDQVVVALKSIAVSMPCGAPFFVIITVGMMIATISLK